MWKPGDRVGERFELETRIRAGGMGVVWRARDERGQTVAVKLLESTHATDLERFRREVKTLAALAHPAIVAHVADGLLDDGGCYLAMEWIDGVTVGDRLLDEGFSVAEAVAVVRRVCEGLGAAHRAGIVHRDLKPSNVMLRGDGIDDVKVIDFGIARVPGFGRTLTRTGAAVGTPGYMAPEQARGIKQILPAADVFAIGCLLHECATGRPAFSGTVAAAVLVKILVSEPPPLAVECPEAPPALGELLARMLAKDPEARPRDADAVLASLDGLGPIPDGPRRHTRDLVEQPTVPWRDAATPDHCIVMAANGELGDELDPPTPEQTAALRRALAAEDAALEVLRTGAVLARIAGERREVARRAARCALALRDVLDGWAIAISAVSSDLSAVVDGGTAVLATAAIAQIFAPAGAAAVITIDPVTAALVASDFDVEAGDPPRLRSERRRG